MGWTTTHKPRHEGTKEFIERRVLRWSDDCPATYRVLDSAIVGLKTYYAAVERIDKATGEREVWAAVILLSYTRGEHNFGWKDMDETMGPVESRCPERILDLLTPTDSEYANEWRARCRAFHAASKARPKIKVGMKLELYGKDYEVVNELGRRGFYIKGIDHETCGRLSHMRARQATIKDTK